MTFKKVVIFSHGFGVQKDDRGLFTDIAKNFLPNVLVVMFDYNEVSEDKKTLSVRPFSHQVKLLNENIENVKKAHPNLPITVIAHSQGCVVAAIAGPNIEKAIMLAPSPSLNIDRLVQNFSDRPGTIIDLDGISKLTRRDGSVTLVGSDYIRELRQTEPIPLYKKLASHAKVVMVRATDDEVLGLVSYDGLDNAKVIDVAANHDFTGNARSELAGIIKRELV